MVLLRISSRLCVYTSRWGHASDHWTALFYLVTLLSSVVINLLAPIRLRPQLESALFWRDLISLPQEVTWDLTCIQVQPSIIVTVCMHVY